MLGTGLDEGTVPQGPMAELGVLYGTNPRIGGRLRYQQLLSEQEQPWGAVSLDVILGGNSGFYLFGGMRLLELGGAANDEAPREWTSGLGLGLPLGRHVALGGEVAYAWRSGPEGGASRGDPSASGLKAGVLLRFFPDSDP